jgi:hypothetical protein
MAWYDLSKSTTSKIRVSVRKLLRSLKVTGSSIFPNGYALMPGMIPRKGKMEVRSLGSETPMAPKVSTYRILMLLPPSISALVRHLLLMMGSTRKG